MNTDRSWKTRMCATPFFGPCAKHDIPCTFFDMDTPDAPPLCTHCVEGSRSRLIRVRRYMYRNVVRHDDIGQVMDTRGVQRYTVNGSAVVFIAPSSRTGSMASTSKCGCCRRPLREGSTYCSLACLASAPPSLPPLLKGPARWNRRKQRKPVRSPC